MAVRRLPESGRAALLIDTSFPEVTKAAPFALGASYTVNGPSLVVFLLA
jgi:hypothetical protein